MRFEKEKLWILKKKKGMKILYLAYSRCFDRTQLELEEIKKKHFHCKINKYNEGMNAEKSIEVRTNHVAY